MGKISTPVHKANLQFKAIYLPPGKHLVEFKHEPNSFWNLVLFGYFFQIIALILWRKTRLSPSMTPLG